MLKGVNKTIIEVNSRDSIYFEKAVFYLRPEVRSLPAEFIRREAEKYIYEPVSMRRKMPVGKIAAIVVLSLIAAGCFAGAFLIS